MFGSYVCILRNSFEETLTCKEELLSKNLSQSVGQKRYVAIVVHFLQDVGQIGEYLYVVLQPFKYLLCFCH